MSKQSPLAPGYTMDRLCSALDNLNADDDHGCYEVEVLIARRKLHWYLKYAGETVKAFDSPDDAIEWMEEEVCKSNNARQGAVDRVYKQVCHLVEWLNASEHQSTHNPPSSSVWAEFEWLVSQVAKAGEVEGKQ